METITYTKEGNKSTINVEVQEQFPKSAEKRVTKKQ